MLMSDEAMKAHLSKGLRIPFARRSSSTSPLTLLSGWEDSYLQGKRGGARGFHEGIFDEGFGGFTPLKRKRRPEMTSRGIHGDAFTGGESLLGAEKRQTLHTAFADDEGGK